MNKLFSYLYELNWRFIRKDDLVKGKITIVLMFLAFIPLAITAWMIDPTFNDDLVPIVFLLFIQIVLAIYFFQHNYIQEKFQKFMSEKVKFGKEVDQKFKELKNLCDYSGKFNEIKNLADFVFPKLLELHGEKEVEYKIFRCFNSTIKEDNLDVIRYFIFEQNVKVPKEFRKNLENHFPDIGNLLVNRDLKDELDKDLIENKPQAKTKQTKI